MFPAGWGVMPCPEKNSHACPAVPSACTCGSVHVRLTWSISVFRHCGNFGGCAVTVAGRAPCAFLNFSLSLSNIFPAPSFLFACALSALVPCCTYVYVSVALA